MIPDWLQEIATGVAVVSGIAGFTLGYLAYRRTGKVKSLDLRIELRKAEADLRKELHGLVALIDRANHSRAANFSAAGLLRSGARQAWDSSLALDRVYAERLEALSPPAGDHKKASQSELEAKLVDVHETMLEAEHLRERYSSSLTEDKRASEQRMAEAAARHLKG